MITLILFTIWIIVMVIALAEECEEKTFIILLLSSLLWIILIFTGVSVKNNEGQYKGYITAVERNGAIFVGYNAYLKTDLTSSNEDMACIDRENKELIEALKEAQESKENITVEYEGVWQYKIGECPESDWKIIRIIN